MLLETRSHERGGYAALRFREWLRLSLLIMPKKEDIHAQVDQRLDALLSQLQVRQSAYLKKNGRYWQGLRTHDDLPKDGERKPAQLKRRPSDQPEDWEAFGFSLGAVEASFRVDTYDGPKGKGYTVTTEVEIEGKAYARVVNFGPEAHREAAWHVRDSIRFETN